MSLSSRQHEIDHDRRNFNFHHHFQNLPSQHHHHHYWLTEQRMKRIDSHEFKPRQRATTTRPLRFHHSARRDPPIFWIFEIF